MLRGLKLLIPVGAIALSPLLAACGGGGRRRQRVFRVRHGRRVGVGHVGDDG